MKNFDYHVNLTCKNLVFVRAGYGYNISVNVRRMTFRLPV